MIINIIAKVNGKTFSGPVQADSIWDARAKFLRTYRGATIVFERISEAKRDGFEAAYDDAIERERGAKRK